MDIFIRERFVADIGITLMLCFSVLPGTNYYIQQRSWKRVVCNSCNKRKMNTDAVAVVAV